VESVAVRPAAAHDGLEGATAGNIICSVTRYGHHLISAFTAVNDNITVGSSVLSRSPNDDKGHEVLQEHTLSSQEKTEGPVSTFLYLLVTSTVRHGRERYHIKST